MLTASWWAEQTECSYMIEDDGSFRQRQTTYTMVSDNLKIILGYKQRFVILKILNLLLPSPALNRPGRSACCPPSLLAAGPRDYLGRNRLGRRGTWEPASCTPVPACTQTHSHMHTCTHMHTHSCAQTHFPSFLSLPFFLSPFSIPSLLCLSLSVFLISSFTALRLWISALLLPLPFSSFLLFSLTSSVLMSTPPLSTCVLNPLLHPVFASVLTQPLLYLFFLDTQMILCYNCL